MSHKFVKEKQYPDFHHTQPDEIQQMVQTERGYWAGRDPEDEINSKFPRIEGDSKIKYMAVLGILALSVIILGY
jgi:hypothetical protein